MTTECSTIKTFPKVNWYFFQQLLKI